MSAALLLAYVVLHASVDEREQVQYWLDLASRRQPVLVADPGV